MIIVTRLSGERFALNPDLLERIESTPDTVLVMLDDSRYLVQEPIDTVTDLIIERRAEVVSRALRYESTSNESEVPAPLLLPVLGENEVSR